MKTYIRRQQHKNLKHQDIKQKEPPQKYRLGTISNTKLLAGLNRQIVGIPMGTNCAPLVADLFLYCYERDFMDSLNHDNQADVIEAFNSTSRYLDDLLNIGNPYFEGMVNQIYPSELQLNKANISDTEAPFLDLHLSVANGFVSSKIYDKRDDFDFDIVNFPFLDGDVPRRASYGVYISQLIRFARVCNDVTDFNARNKSILLWRFILFYVLVFKIFLCCWRLMYVCIFLVKVTEWPPIGKIAAHSAYEMFSWYM